MGDTIMYYFLSIFIGILVTIMVVFNGELTSLYGVYISTAIIHLVGLLFVSILCLIKKTPLLIKRIPILLYTGGALGVITVYFNNLAFDKISVSAILALSLLGQAITSIIIDNYGYFNMPKQAFNKKKYISISFLIIGIVFMLSTATDILIIPIILSLITGITVVTSRAINSNLAEKSTLLASTWYYYFIGAIISFIIFIFSYKNIDFGSFSFSNNIIIYFGGVLGALTVFLSNIAVTKISSFYMTLLLFIGQVFSGIISDIILTQKFSEANLVGGILVAIGLAINLWIDKKEKVDIKSS